MGLWQLFWCVSRGPSSTFVYQLLVEHHLWCQTASIWVLNRPQICFQDNWICYSAVSYDLSHMIWQFWTIPVTGIYLSRFSPPKYYLSGRLQFMYCDLSFCVVAWYVRGKQHSSSFSALGRGHEPLASRGQPVPPQSAGLRARQAGQLPVVTL